MTRLSRPGSRVCAPEVISRGRGRAIIVSLEPPGELIGLRLKGERRTYHLPVAWLYLEAVRRSVALERKNRPRKAIHERVDG